MSRIVSLAILVVALAGCVCPRAPGQAAATRSPGSKIAEPRKSDGDEGGVALNKDKKCFSDAECTLPARCIKPKGGFGDGWCGQVVDDLGMPKIGIDTEVNNCSFDTDCPMFFQCKKLDALHGVCTKR